MPCRRTREFLAHQADFLSHPAEFLSQRGAFLTLHPKSDEQAEWSTSPTAAPPKHSWLEAEDPPLREVDPNGTHE